MNYNQDMNEKNTNNELRKTQDFFKKDLFATETTGCQIDKIDDYYAQCTLNIKKNHRNGYGAIMGGAIFTLADFTFAVASNHNGKKVVSVTSQISFLGSSKGTVLIAEAKLIKDGRTTCVYEITVSDDLGAKIAFVTVSGMKLK